MGTKTRISQPRTPKKAKQVTGDKMKIKKLGELKKITKKLDKMFSPDGKREKIIDKLFDQKRKLKEQLGIE